MRSRLSDAKTAYTYDDFIIIPQYSEVPSRKTPDVSTRLGKMKLDIPIVSSPMNTITEHRMMLEMGRLGGASVLHRYMSSDDQLKQCVEALKNKDDRAKNFFIAVGATGDAANRVMRLYDTLGLVNFCIDMANGHSKLCVKTAERFASNPQINLMAGNVCTYEGAYRLAEVGVTSIRVGIGPGSMCKTRVVTGHGVPQLTALEDCARIKDKFPDVSIIADGGVRNSGDIVKALAIGADAVMIGNLLAGTDETPGELYTKHLGNLIGGKYKKYAGMASEEGRKFNGWFTEEDASFVPEGEAVEVPYKGPVKKVIDNLIGGLRTGMSYSGAKNLKELRINAEWFKVTHAGVIEGTPHGKR